MSVTLDHITRTVDGVPTIRDVSLTLERGTLSVLLGPTLSGKTSIMRLLAGLDRPASGRVLVDGKDVTGIDVRRRSVAMVYQQFINYPSLSVYENIASPLRVQGRPRSEIESRVQEAAKLLKLEPYLSRMPLQLSGGQQQRVGFARALAAGPHVILLDEPFGALDPVTRVELRNEFLQLRRRLGLTAVMVTHDMTEALLSADLIAVMNGGRLLRLGTPHELMTEPGDPFVAALMSTPKREADQLEALVGPNTLGGAHV